MISAVYATVPLSFLKVIVLSAVGSVNVRVVSNASSVAPSITMLPSEIDRPETTGLVKVLFVNV